MIRKRTAHRRSLLLTMAAAVFLAFGSFWLLQLMQRGDGKIDPSGMSNEPDYIVEKFSFVRMTPEGQPRYLFYGAKLTHRPIDDVSDVEKPIVQSLVPGEPPMTISAQRARMYHPESKVDLLGKVDIRRPASATTRNLHVTTEALTVFPDEERMQSDVKVDAMLGAATVSGTGMQVNNATRQLEFGGRGRIVYPPKPAR